MNTKRIARTYLGWFEQEAHNQSISKADGSSSLIWNDAGSYVIGYTSAHGFHSYQAFVRDISGSRLPEVFANAVLNHAVAMVGAN